MKARTVALNHSGGRAPEEVADRGHFQPGPRHLHVHIYPRYSGDPFEGRPIDAARNAPFVRSDADLERLRAAITEAAAESESQT